MPDGITSLLGALVMEAALLGEEVCWAVVGGINEGVYYRFMPGTTTDLNEWLQSISEELAESHIKWYSYAFDAKALEALTTVCDFTQSASASQTT